MHTSLTVLGALVSTGFSSVIPSRHSLQALSSRDSAQDWETSTAGNPLFDGWYADPDSEYYNGEHWIFPTYSQSYEKQTFLDAYSSKDLINWTKHANVLTTADFSWATKAVWAPAPISRNGKYYLYFGANDIQSDSDLGGIGVGVADAPEGPYKDALGKPMIGQYYNGAQPIDQDVFIDDDGQAYIYYGGHSHANVALLNEDMITIGTFPDGSQFKEITPENYVEGPQMLKKDGKYYLFWSEGGWTGPSYAVSYAISDSPLGPFNRIDKILQQDTAVATGSGHNGVIRIPDTDIYYIVYHRHPLGSTDGNNRVVCYDRLHFNTDGTIQPIKMLVQDNFDDNNMLGWTTYGDGFTASNQTLQASQSDGAKALLNTNFGDLTLSIDVTLNKSTESDGDAGVVFRATNPTDAANGFLGYYAGIKQTGHVVLWRMDSAGPTQISDAAMNVYLGTTYHLQVKASGSNISVFVDDMSTPLITQSDGTYASGMDGVRAYQVAATFDNLNLQEGA